MQASSRKRANKNCVANKRGATSRVTRRACTRLRLTHLHAPDSASSTRLSAGFSAPTMTRWKRVHVPPSGLPTSERLAAGGGRRRSRSRSRVAVAVVCVRVVRVVSVSQTRRLASSPLTASLAIATAHTHFLI